MILILCVNEDNNHLTNRFYKIVLNPSLKLVGLIEKEYPKVSGKKHDDEYTFDIFTYLERLGPTHKNLHN